MDEHGTELTSRQREQVEAIVEARLELATARLKSEAQPLLEFYEQRRAEEERNQRIRVAVKIALWVQGLALGLTLMGKALWEYIWKHPPGPPTP